ncbi:MAG: PglL family O-oligosaccharyltransferase [Rhodoferax sp.]
MPSFVVFICIALPWLNPFSYGPSPAVVQWLTTLGSLAFILLWSNRGYLAEVSTTAWLDAALISAAVGLLQYFGASAGFRPWINTSDLGEAFANLRQRNQFATLTNIGLAALLSLMHRYRSNRPLSLASADSGARLWRVAAILAAVLLALGNAASSSRTGLLQLLLLFVMAWVWSRPGGARLWSVHGVVLLAAALAYVVGAFALPALAGLDSAASGILGRLHDGESRCLGRLTLWSNVLHLIAQKPWWGWGWGELDFAHFITLYPGQRFCDILDNAHNLPLHLAVELGVPLSVAICGLGIGLVWRCRPWRETDPSRQLAWSVLALILLHSMLEYPLWYGPFQMAFGLSVFLLWKSPKRGPENPDNPRSPPSGLLQLMAIFLLVTVVYAGWDYRRISQIYQSPAARDAAYRENTLEKIQDSWLFRNQVRFAELTTSTLNPGNAAHFHDMAADLLHFSPEPRVVEKLIESAALMGLEEERQYYLQRYKAAFPQSYALWLKEEIDNGAGPGVLQRDRSEP